VGLLLLWSAAGGAETVQWRSEFLSGYRSLNYFAGTTNVKGTVLSAGLGLTAVSGRFYGSLTAERDVRTLSSDGNFNRADTALSIGYGAGDNISLFIGYKQGVTKLDTPELRAKGLFLGAGAGLPTNIGVFSFSAAYADLSANYRDNNLYAYSGNARGTSLSVAWHNKISNALSYGLSLVHHEYYYQHFNILPFSVNENILSLHANIQYHF
jgi:hypothetical protein